MTLSTWKTEFYPTEASECSKEDAIEHSLRKWRGLRASELQRHWVAARGARLIGEEQLVFFVNNDSCALCAHFLDAPDRDCDGCPLVKARLGVPCDDRTYNEELSPFAAWIVNRDPEPMIAALELAQKEQP